MQPFSIQVLMCQLLVLIQFKCLAMSSVIKTNVLIFILSDNFQNGGSVLKKNVRFPGHVMANFLKFHKEFLYMYFTEKVWGGMCQLLVLIQFKCLAMSLVIKTNGKC
jgi:hypothetical protein